MWNNRQHTLTKMTILKFSQTLEQHIQNEIKEAYPLNWNEDYITRRLVVTLGRLSYSQVEVLSAFNNVFITPFKLAGKNENKFGDIAIIVDLEFKDGDKLKGVAFLEAKIRYENSNEYTALKFDQLERIFSNAPNARLLLYNYQHMSSLSPTGLDTKIGTSGILPQIPVTYTSVTHLNTAIELKKKNDRLHKLSIPFSYQFSFRYLYGMDLEYDEEIINSAQGYLSNKYGMPNYVVIITVKPGKKDEKEVEELYPKINQELYLKIIDKESLNK